MNTGLCLMHTHADTKLRRFIFAKALLNDGSNGETKSFKDNDLKLGILSSLPIAMLTYEL